MKPTNIQNSAYAVLDQESWHRPGLRGSLIGLGLHPLYCTDATLQSVLKTVPEHKLFLVLISSIHRQGLQGYQWMLERVQALHRECPSTGIVFVSDSKTPWRTQTLPPLTWVTQPALNELCSVLERVHRQKLERCPCYRESGLMLSHVPLAARPTPLPAHMSIPNYNIKHPAMLIPLAIASVSSGSELYCEISPQEALTYYDHHTSGSPRQRVCQVLQELRRAVTEVNQYLGSRLRLHLDHCDDLYLLEYAADQGFDSVMADGSARGLAQNISFVQRARHVLGPYAVALEGEVGHIDGHGARRWNRTRCADLSNFLAETGVDFVGLHLGQFHGFSYDFQRSRSLYAELQEVRDATGEQDWQAFLNACHELDEQLQELGIRRDSAERKLIASVAGLALDGQATAPATVHALLRRPDIHCSLRLSALLDELHTMWLTGRLRTTQWEQQQWQQILRHEQPLSSKQHARLDLALLEELSAIAYQHGARPVIHGGSSISDDDLSLLSGFGVARVNFGTDVFQEFLSQLAVGHATIQQKQLSTWSGRQAFLSEAAENWPEWLAQPPATMRAFADRLVSKHLRRMSRTSSQVNLPTAVAVHA